MLNAVNIFPTIGVEIALRVSVESSRVKVLIALRKWEKV